MYYLRVISQLTRPSLKYDSLPQERYIPWVSIIPVCNNWIQNSRCQHFTRSVSDKDLAPQKFHFDTTIFLLLAIKAEPDWYDLHYKVFLNKKLST